MSEPSLPDGETAAERYRSVDTVSAVAVTVVENASGTTRRRAELVRRPGTGESWRRTVAPERDAGDLTVSNGSVTWLYDESEGNVTRIDATAYERADGTYADYLERLFEAVSGEDDAADEGAVGVSPLPVVPATDRPAPVTNGTVGGFVVSYEGTATVDGRTAHVLDLTPRGEADGEFATLGQTLYLDTEHLYPLRQRMSYRVGGNTTTYTVTYRNVSFGDDVAPDRFAFDPPANATVEELSLPDSTRYDSVDALRANTTMSVPAPSLPDGFDVESARHTVSSERNYTGITLTYSNGSASVFVSTYNRTAPFGDATRPDDGEAVRLGDRNATYSEYGVAKRVAWTCEAAGSYRSVSTDALPRGALLDVARSVGCGGDEGTAARDGPTVEPGAQERAYSE